MRVHEAIDSIATIQTQIARAQVFRGYRALPVGITGALALIGAALQDRFVPAPGAQLDRYVVYWGSIATVSLGGCLVGMLLRYRRNPTRLAKASTLAALERLTPSLIVGAIVTLVVARDAPSLGAYLPGLWQLLFCLGVFASLPQLPRATVVVAFLYLTAGAANLALAGQMSFSPWVMGLVFGVGQLAAAAILYLTLEQRDDE